MKVQQEIREPWRSHLQQVQQAIRQDSQQILMLKGQAAELEQLNRSRADHASAMVKVLCAEADLPESITGYMLSEDGKYLVGETKEEKP